MGQIHYTVSRKGKGRGRTTKYEARVREVEILFEVLC
jgi:ribosomal protein L16/L10AE